MGHQAAGLLDNHLQVKESRQTADITGRFDKVLPFEVTFHSFRRVFCAGYTDLFMPAAGAD